MRLFYTLACGLLMTALTAPSVQAQYEYCDPYDNCMSERQYDEYREMQQREQQIEQQERMQQLMQQQQEMEQEQEMQRQEYCRASGTC